MACALVGMEGSGMTNVAPRLHFKLQKFILRAATAQDFKDMSRLQTPLSKSGEAASMS